MFQNDQQNVWQVLTVRKEEGGREEGLVKEDTHKKTHTSALL